MVRDLVVVMETIGGSGKRSGGGGLLKHDRDGGGLVVFFNTKTVAQPDWVVPLMRNNDGANGECGAEQDYLLDGERKSYAGERMVMV